MIRNKTDVAAAICAAAFVVVLVVSAYWDRSIRVLHVFESLPYIAAAILCLRRSKVGYALGVAGGASWLWMAGFLTTFIRNGFQRLVMLYRPGGGVDRPDLLIAVPAAIATSGLVLFSVAGYARLPHKSWRDLGLLAAAVVGVLLFFILIFAAFAPRYLAMFQRLIR
ncbi:MAG: hypothetical protein DMF82_02305 [Acidobacteria bacterium]|nr:MAG: hypothetical protein DMF82_02305 [Acidobacteriota bacterium]